VTTDRQELLELTDRIRGLDGVSSTETFFYLEMWKQLYDWGTRG
jgi:Lrp/AsnC family transcriptional regulator for asnA, asnC and gidA